MLRDNSIARLVVALLLASPFCAQAQRGNITSDQVATSSKYGTGTKLQSSDGTGLVNHLATYAADGKLTDGGLLPSSFVTSFNGRSGAVAPANGDYSFSLISGIISSAQLPSSGVTAGSYTCTSETVDATGRVTAASSGTCSGSGTVTSVGLSLPAIFSVSGTPITTAGTLTATLATQAANTFFAGPSSGAAAAPTFRAIVPADLPLGSAAAFGAVKCDGTTITCASGVISSVSGGAGTVTSVALSMPSDYSVSGSPVTGAGTLTVTGGVTKSAVQQQSYVYAADTGSANAYAVTLSPAPTIVAGSHVVFKAANANTTASTLAVNGGTATAIKKQGSTALVSGDIPAGGIEEVVYDGTNYQLIASAGTGGSGPTLQTNGTNNGSQSTLNLKSGTGATVTNSGTDVTISASGGGSLVLLESHTASSSAELDFTTSITSTYDEYMVELVNLVPATNLTDLFLQFSTNGGSTYDATSGHYAWATFRFIASTYAVSGSTSTTSICLTTGAAVTSNTASNGGIVGTYKIFNPLSGTMHTLIRGENNSWYSADPTMGSAIGGSYLQTTAVNAFRIFFGSGNIASGTVRVYGIAH